MRWPMTRSRDCEVEFAVKIKRLFDLRNRFGPAKQPVTIGQSSGDQTTKVLPEMALN
jgi:hypothetical protein